MLNNLILSDKFKQFPSLIYIIDEMTGSQQIENALKRGAKQQPLSPAILEIEPTTSTDYAQLSAYVSNLRTYLGEASKTIVAALPSGLPNCVLWLTCLSSGHQLIPISPDVTDYEFQHILDKHLPDVIITDRSPNPATVQTTCLSSTIVGQAMRMPVKASQVQAARDGSVYLSTSGSTGTPKGIILSATQCVITAQNIIASHELTANDRALTLLPFYHVNAPIVSLLSTILSGGQLAVTPKYDTDHFWGWVKDANPTWISIVPTMVAMLLSTERPAFLDASELRFIRTASAPLSKATLTDFEAKFKIPLVETYGVSEAASMIVANPVPPGTQKAGSVGLPAGITLQIYDAAQQRAVANGTVGEVRIKGPNVITSYVDDRDPDAFSEGWFNTGDLGYLDEDGYLFLTGRSKDIIIRGGENIFPRVIEELLTSFPAVREAVVVGQPDALFGEKIIAYITTSSAEADLTTQLHDYLAKRLSRQLIPVSFYILDDFPRTKAGKIDKPLLRRYNQTEPPTQQPDQDEDGPSS